MQPNAADPAAANEAMPSPAGQNALEQADAKAAGPAEAAGVAAGAVAEPAEDPPRDSLGEAVVEGVQLVFSPLASLGRSMSSLFSPGDNSSGGGGDGGSGDGGGGEGGGGGGGGGMALDATVTRLEALVGGGDAGSKLSGSGVADEAPPSGTPTAAQLAQLEVLVERLEGSVEA